MNRYIIFLSILILVVISIFDTQAIIASSSNNTIHGLDNCSFGIILLDAINKTIENITNITSKGILYRIEDLLEKLDCNVLERMVQFMYLHPANAEIKQYYSVINYRGEYTRLNNSTIINSRIVPDNYKNYIITKNVNNDDIRKQNNRIDPFLVVINIVSIVSFAIGIYIFRIIKKRMDYI